MKWLILLLILIPLVSGSSSENFAINSLVISGGGSNTTSSNYETNLLVGDIAGNTSSGNYSTYLGFWYSNNYFIGDLTWMIALILGLLGVVIFLIGWGRKSEHKAIQLLFTFLAAFICMVIFNVMTIIGEVDLTPMLSGLMWSTIFAIAIVMIMVFFNIKLYKYKENEKSR
tara:strand:- start:2424 stop:2936 length:513 start_codon:yes stop_codon:yes gene_type:complete